MPEPQIGPTRVADEHVYAGSEATVEEGCNPIGEITLIKEVADRDEIHGRRRTGGEIIADRRDLDTVQFGVEVERGEGVAIDLSRDHLACSGFRRCDADDARTRAEVEHATARHRLRPVEDVAGQGRATGPMISPSRVATVRTHPRPARQDAKDRSLDGLCKVGFREAWGLG